MEILLSSTGFAPASYGGGEVYVYRLAKGLLAKGHRVRVLAGERWAGGSPDAGPWRMRDYRHDGIPVSALSIDPDRVGFFERETGHGPLVRRAVEAALDRMKPDLVHASGFKSVLAQICHDRSLPFLLTAHHAGVVCSRSTGVDPGGSECDREINEENCVPCACLARGRSLRMGKILAGLPRWASEAAVGMIRGPGSKNLGVRSLAIPWVIRDGMRQRRDTLTLARGVVAPSRYMKELLTRGGCDPRRIFLLPHGPHDSAVLRARPLGRTLGIGYVGRINPDKGLHLLLEAVSLLRPVPACEIHLFGAPRDEREERYLQGALARGTGAHRLICHGAVQPQRITSLYELLDVVVVPSLIPEAYGMVVAEARAAGVPAVVFPAGALREQVDHGVNGWIVNERSGVGLAAALQMLLDTPALVASWSGALGDAEAAAERHLERMESWYGAMLSPGTSWPG